jgi:hypothetical protein
MRGVLGSGLRGNAARIGFFSAYLNRIPPSSTLTQYILAPTFCAVPIDKRLRRRHQVNPCLNKFYGEDEECVGQMNSAWRWWGVEA